jgi:hypothetical protein
MNRRFRVLPSGCDVSVCSVIDSPFDGAISSVSHASMNIVNIWRAATAVSDCASASRSSRLETSPSTGMPPSMPITRLMRGSILGSLLMSAMALLLLSPLL